MTQIGILETNSLSKERKSATSALSIKSNQLLTLNSDTINNEELKSISKHTTPDLLDNKLTDSFVKPTESIVINQDFTSRASSVLKSRQSMSSVGSIASQSLRSTHLLSEKPSTSQSQLQPTPPPPSTSPAIEEFLPNRSGIEWRGGYEGSDEYLRNIFNFMDYDQDGQVKLEEVKRVLDVLNSKFKRNYIELSAIVFLNTFDKNKDGHIDFDEFRDSIREILNLK